jgi:hypothetical protein
MAERIKFATPQAVVFRGAELDGPLTIDPDTGRVSGTFSLIRDDGKRWRSIAFSFDFPAAVSQFSAALLRQIEKRSIELDGATVVLAGTVEDKGGEPVSVVAPR